MTGLVSAYRRLKARRAALRLARVLAVSLQLRY
jgi:hypothetical protein